MSGEPPELWPLWLSADIERLGIWSVEYDSSPTLWRGHSMARADRANNVLARLLAESRLRKGDVAFVTHSFGGLVFEQILRVANERSPAEPKIAELLKRISRVTFLGTPHRGADLAIWGGMLGLVTRLSDAARGLERNDPDLRDLNQFYREYALHHHIDTQSLVETRPIPFLGMIVKPDSADIGLPSIPIPVDANHFTIACPPSRNSEVYIHVRDQLRKQLPSPKTVLADVDTLQAIVTGTDNNSATLARIEEHLSSNRDLSQPKVSIPSELVDAETVRRLSIMRRKRFFAESGYLEDASRLAEDLLNGALAATSANIKADTLAWCARLLLSKDDKTEALQILTAARRINGTEAVAIGRAKRRRCRS